MGLASDTAGQSKSGIDGRLFFVILVFVTVVAAVVTWVAGGVITLMFQGLCGDPATPEGLRSGRTWLAVLTGLSVLVWALVALLTSRPWWVTAAGLVASAPAAYFTIEAFASTAAEWTDPWCLF
jgi:hypothetical protein